MIVTELPSVGDKNLHFLFDEEAGIQDVLQH
jgi:hypothetical protein